MGRTKGKILVIDESVHDIEILEQIFSLNDYEVIWAPSGNDGIRLAETAEPDVILLELTLPDMKGLDVCRNLRLRNSTWSIPIILVTGQQTEETEIVRGLELGANDCVTRPFKKTELMGRVGVLMRMKRVEDKIRRLYIERTRELEWSNMELQKVRTQLIFKNQMSTLGLMVAVAAHEIRSPAASISGNLELMGTLIREFIDGLTRLPEVMQNATPDEVQRFYQVLREMTETNLREPPLDVIGRRREGRAMAIKLRDFLQEEPDEDMVAQLAKFRMGPQLELIGPLMARYGIHVLKPVFQMGELLVKFKNMSISIDRINSIVRAMKAYSHIDRAELQEISIHDGLDDTLTIMNYIFRGSIEVVRRYAPDLPATQGYPGELNQVWTNLLQNAYDAMEGQKGRITVETRLEMVKGLSHVAVRITDTGKGIPREILPHIFDSFFTTKEKGRGSGLGLDICKRIVEKHRGSIDVATIPGETTFTVYLPVERRRDEPVDKNEPEAPITTAAGVDEDRRSSRKG